jgi:hypothetical protein
VQGKIFSFNFQQVAGETFAQAKSVPRALKRERILQQLMTRVKLVLFPKPVRNLGFFAESAKKHKILILTRRR